MPWKFEGRTLTSPEGREYPAISGPHGRGKLPSGEYEIGGYSKIEKENPLHKRVVDETRNAWWVTITPKFKTDRDRLGIHPDGNVIGTLGCIGLRCKDTGPAFEELRKAKGETLIVP